MKTIGVLGGIGPQATMEFEVRLHRAAQRLIPQRANSGYPPTVVAYHRRPPFVMDNSGVPVLPYAPDPELLLAAKRLGEVSDFLVITSNATHLVSREIEKEAGREVLSMIDLVVEEVVRRQWRQVGVVGLGRPAVYIEPLEKRGLKTVIVDDAIRARVDKEIFRVMEGSNGNTSNDVAREAIAALRGDGADGVILGCTEIPIMLGEESESEDLLNPLVLLADAAIRKAIA